MTPHPKTIMNSTHICPSNIPDSAGSVFKYSRASCGRGLTKEGDALQSRSVQRQRNLPLNCSGLIRHFCGGSISVSSLFWLVLNSDESFSLAIEVQVIQVFNRM